jgi:beta-1,4-mannosyl-glycoprotein beta-1,4-N-acetylglucosaminyltransferase
MKILDCFIFYNELDILLYRLSILYKIVDFFIIVESKYTFVGNEKKMYYNEIKDTLPFLLYKDKIIHIILENCPFPHPDYNNNEQWKNEYFQRDSIKLGIDQINLNDDDLIFISDVDEILDPNCLDKIKNNDIYVNKIYNLFQVMYFYNLNNISTLEWNKSYVCPYNIYKKLNNTISEIRIKNSYSTLNEKCGWHLSYFGDKNFVYNKLLNFSHQEHNGNINIDDIEISINKNTSPTPTIFVDLNVNNYKPIYNEIFFKKYTKY